MESWEVLIIENFDLTEKLPKMASIRGRWIMN